MYAEMTIAPGRVRESVAGLVETAQALGAYASGTRVRYLFLRRQGVLCATVDAGAGALPSMANEIPLYDWHEREMQEKQGIAFDGHPDTRPLYIDDRPVSEAMTAQGEGINVVVVGPVHAGIIEPGRFTFSTGGETTIHLDTQFSYSHRDIESALAGRQVLEIAPRVARICGGCSVARSWSYSRAVESLAGITCDEATEYARVVLAELERLYNHVFDLANAASGAGYGRGMTVGLGLKERILQLCEAATQHRLMFDAIAPGGVRTGVLSDPQALLADLRAVRMDVERFAEELFGNRSVVRRFAGAGWLDGRTAQAFGACGPAARASGVELDVRTFCTYGAYAALDVRIATATDGDVLARCSVKRSEIAESFRLIDTSLAALAQSSIPEPQSVECGTGRVTTAVEGPRGIETLSVEVGGDGAIERLHVISASYRNWPTVARAMEGNIIPDFPLVNKSFNLCYSCMDR